MMKQAFCSKINRSCKIYIYIFIYIIIWSHGIVFVNYNRVCKPLSRSRTREKKERKWESGSRKWRGEFLAFPRRSSPFTITSHDSIRPISDQTNLRDATVCYDRIETKFLFDGTIERKFQVKFCLIVFLK